MLPPHNNCVLTMRSGSVSVHLRDCGFSWPSLLPLYAFWHVEMHIKYGVRVNYNGPKGLLCSLRNKGGIQTTVPLGSHRTVANDRGLISRAGQGLYRLWVPLSRLWIIYTKLVTSASVPLTKFRASRTINETKSIRHSLKASSLSCRKLGRTLMLNFLSNVILFC